MNEYFNQLNKTSHHRTTLEMKRYAQENKVPIIQDEGLLYLKQIVRLSQSINILEIGTAIGYSAIELARINPKIHVDTIEKEESMVKLALENVAKSRLNARVRVFHADALTIDLSLLLPSYDLVFIDAAKAQYIKFFEKFDQLVKPKGLIVSDNLLFHGLVTTTEKIVSKNLRMLIGKIKKYNEWLTKNKGYNTTFLPIGDGMAVSEKC